ncbi:MAG: nucleoside phosphorylase [Bacteroidetes bacterium]|nr:nucleoside phosphorylase [Bacteroidota bacterium]
MQLFPETELIITDQNRVYHLDINEEHIADDVILVGDQGRVEQISKLFSKVECKIQHREFVTHTGTFNGKRISVVSTGIGTDNIDIVVNELDAAVNIDLKTRSLKPTLRQLNLIRLGTSGALQADIPVNALVVSQYGLGLDGLLNYYADYTAINENHISQAFMKHSQWTANLPFPYCIKANDTLFKKFADGNPSGITATAPGFYGPQGRQLRLKAAKPQLNELLSSFCIDGLRIANFEMETSALYGLGKMLNHNCLTVCVIIANRVLKEFTPDYQKSVNKLITNSLERLTS